MKGAFLPAIPAQPPPRPSFPFTDTNALAAIKEAEDFAEQYFGHRPDLRTQFVMPETFPWEEKEVIAVYDPGTISNRQVVEQALKSQPKLKRVYEEENLMDYEDANASGKPTLRFVARSETPTADLMDLSADEMVATKRTLLDQRGYIIGFGTYHKVTGGFLEQKTGTRFPASRLPDGKVADGGWNRGCTEFCFSRARAGRRITGIGGRETVECPLRIP